MERLPLVLEYVRSLGYPVFTEGKFNLNIIGLRSINPSAGLFDDRMFVAYRDVGWVVKSWPITTDPSASILANERKWYNDDGVAILAKGRYPNAYIIGPHGSTKYEALVQHGGPVKVYRDSTLDRILDLDPSTIQEGYFGINIHASSTTPYEGSDVDRTDGPIGAWSAGCQVFASDAHFREFMTLCKRSAKLYGNLFTYLLEDEPVS